jgi:hypothetical protein
MAPVFSGILNHRAHRAACVCRFAPSFGFLLTRQAIARLPMFFDCFSLFVSLAVPGVVSGAAFHFVMMKWQLSVATDTCERCV